MHPVSGRDRRFYVTRRTGFPVVPGTFTSRKAAFDKAKRSWGAQNMVSRLGPPRPAVAVIQNRPAAAVIQRRPAAAIQKCPAAAKIKKRPAAAALESSAVSQARDSLCNFINQRLLVML